MDFSLLKLNGECGRCTVIALCLRSARLPGGDHNVHAHLISFLDQGSKKFHTVRGDIRLKDHYEFALVTHALAFRKLQSGTRYTTRQSHYRILRRTE
jgi:hypothetical protein